MEVSGRAAAPGARSATPAVAAGGRCGSSDTVFSTLRPVAARTRDARARSSWRTGIPDAPSSTTAEHAVGATLAAAGGLGGGQAPPGGPFARLARFACQSDLAVGVGDGEGRSSVAPSPVVADTVHAVDATPAHAVGLMAAVQTHPRGVVGGLSHPLGTSPFSGMRVPSDVLGGVTGP